MQTIEIRDDLYQDIVKYDDKAHFHKSLENIKNGTAKLYNNVAYKQEMDRFKEKLKAKHDLCSL